MLIFTVFYFTFNYIFCLIVKRLTSSPQLLHREHADKNKCYPGDNLYNFYLTYLPNNCLRPTQRWKVWALNILSYPQKYFSYSFQIFLVKESFTINFTYSKLSTIRPFFGLILQGESLQFVTHTKILLPLMDRWKKRFRFAKLS